MMMEGEGEGEGESIKIKYDYLHVSYKTDLKLIVNEKRNINGFIEGGEFGGKIVKLLLEMENYQRMNLKIIKRFNTVD